MKKVILLLSLSFLVNIGIKAQTPSKNAVTNLSAEDFQKLSVDKNGVIIDLRTTPEMERGFIKGAVQLDFLAKDAEKQIDKLDKKKTYYIYCQSGGRSSDAAEYMEKHGFEHVFNLEKGFSGWMGKGLPVEKK